MGANKIVGYSFVGRPVYSDEPNALYLGQDCHYIPSVANKKEKDTKMIPTRKLGVEVLTVAENGPANYKHIREGDTIISIDKVLIYSPKTIRSVLSRKTHGDSVVVEIERKTGTAFGGKRRLTLNVQPILKGGRLNLGIFTRKKSADAYKEGKKSKNFVKKTVVKVRGETLSAASSWSPGMKLSTPAPDKDTRVFVNGIEAHQGQGTYKWADGTFRVDGVKWNEVKPKPSPIKIKLTEKQNNCPVTDSCFPEARMAIKDAVAKAKSDTINKINQDPDYFQTKASEELAHVEAMLKDRRGADAYREVRKLRFDLEAENKKRTIEAGAKVGELLDKQSNATKDEVARPPRSLSMLGWTLLCGSVAAATGWGVYIYHIFG
ncbi:MAG TPA: PDZ domain-containing protein [Desulfosporosinus sp.]|nr:PDZ domain-containing protein [Desulfosporosinus sp.]